MLPEAFPNPRMCMYWGHWRGELMEPVVSYLPSGEIHRMSDCVLESSLGLLHVLAPSVGPGKQCHFALQISQYVTTSCLLNRYLLSRTLKPRGASLYSTVDISKVLSLGVRSPGLSSVLFSCTSPAVASLESLRRELPVSDVYRYRSNIGTVLLPVFH